jgi:two-component sensor histidine kinase
MLEQAERTGRYEEEAWRVRKDGSRFWANAVITSVRGRDGALEGFAKVTRDFTERRRQDDALHAKQAALTQSLKEREVLLQEVHHRVKNNLQVISSLINMQVRRIDHGSTRDALEECQTRVLAIALIHEKLYQSKDYSEVRFAEYARSLAANVFHATGISPREVSLELAIDEVPLGVDLAIPCGLVINELITNSLKHGFKDGRTGTLRVALSKLDDGKLRLTVSDDGAGLPDGFELHRAESMGLQLVCTLAEQLDASVVVTRDRGASFQLTFAGSR